MTSEDSNILEKLSADEPIMENIDVYEENCKQCFAAAENAEAWKAWGEKRC